MQTNIDNLPSELRETKQWVCWVRDDKVPRNPLTGGFAKANDPSTWGTLSQAVEACEKYGFAGVGFEFAPPYFGVDLDHCMDNQDLCREFVDGLGSYAEYSRSGDGLHIICRGSLPDGARRKGSIEMYSGGRYFICTGNVYDQHYKSVVECTEKIRPLHEKYLQPRRAIPQPEPARATVNLDDREVIERAKGCESGGLFSLLYAGSWQGIYPSQSEADLAFCNMLAFWTGRDADQMDRIFRSSGLLRPKWDSLRNGVSYGQGTIAKAIADCAEVYEPAVHGDGTDLAFAVFGNGKVQKKEQKKRYDQTDTGNAHRLVDRFGNILRYSYNRKKWFVWDGKCWTTDETGAVKKLADCICDDLKKEALEEQDEKIQAQKLKWAMRTAGNRAKEAMIKEAQHLEGIPVMQDELDAYPDYLNCRNGIINLRNGELIPHESGFMMTKLAGCDYDTSGAKPELWMKFLDDVTKGNKSLQEYLQRSVGYSLTGSTIEQCAYFLYGIGNNGKSTFQAVIRDMLGGYCQTVQPEKTLMIKAWGSESMGSDIARLKGARLVVCDEPDDGARLNESLIKQLTGGSRITCRFLYGDEFEYSPEFKIWMAMNHKPKIRGTDNGIWRRIKLLLFEVSIPQEKVDKELAGKLKKELPQILAWAVRGCIKWRQNGLMEPECVKAASQEYRHEMDILEGFIQECLEIDYDYKEKTPARKLFQTYSRWAKANNEYELSSKKFFMEIGKKLPDKGRDRTGIFYRNVKIIDDYGAPKSYNWGT